MAQPVKSMTGFASVTGDVVSGRIAIELKSVNHRYLEFQTRMGEEIRSLEGAMREQVATHDVHRWLASFMAALEHSVVAPR